MQFNGIKVEDDTHLVNIISLTEVNAEVPVMVYRSGKPMSLTVRVGSKPRN